MTQDRITFVLKGVAGSHAHGLATEASDQDLHGVFSVPSTDFWGLKKPIDSITRENPDEAYHEIGRYCRLALGSNPTVLELLYLDEYLEMEPDWGQQLIDIRKSFLSAPAIKSAYLGYSQAQYKRMQNRTTFESPKAKKLIRHSFRLLNQGHLLYTTGEMRTKVSDRDWYLSELPSYTEDYILKLYSELLNAFIEAESPLPERPDVPLVSDFLHAYRRAHLT